MILLRFLFVWAVFLTSSSGLLEEVSKKVEKLFKVFDFKQTKILGEVSELRTEMNGIDVASSGSCASHLGTMKTKLEVLSDYIENYYVESTIVLEAFKEDLSTDECNNGDHDCHRDANCIDLMIGYKCECKGGFTGNGLLCNDVNECSESTHTCNSNAKCKNLHGSYSCSCNDNHYGDGRTCTVRKRCDMESDCPSTSTCKTSESSKYCYCKDSYIDLGSSCQDINECTSGTHECHQDAACTNTQGGYSCTCNLGLKGDGRTCQDNDECSGTNECHGDASCTNTYGSYACSCNAGYSGDGFSCDDVDECEEGDIECQPNSSCSNTKGSYYCLCHIGYSSSADTCSDIDECLDDSSCDSNASCMNTDGSYKCSCNIGYRGDGYNCLDMCPFERVKDVGCISVDRKVISNWAEANEKCQEKGGHLFFPTSATSFSKLQLYLLNDASFDIPEWTGLWVGIYEDTWIGERDVTDEEWTNRYCPNSGKCCGTLLKGPISYSLNNDPCDWPRLSICQWNATKY